MDAENKGLEAQKTDSFNQIQLGANRRGLNFSGIPLSEQASYLGSSFLPAVANLKAKYAQQRFNLQDAIAKITQDQYSKAYGLRADELNREAAERAARASAGSGGGGGGSFGGFGTGVAPGAPPAARGSAPAQRGGVDTARAQAAIGALLATKNNALIQSTINAIRISAGRGNAYDQEKLRLLSSMAGNNRTLSGIFNSKIGGLGGVKF